MSRHELDLMSMLAGLFFTVFGLGFLLDAATDIRVDVEWVLPIALIGVGGAGLVASLISARSTSASTDGGYGDTDAKPADDDVDEDQQQAPAADR
jgi:mannose/fructose/N-acetylgalactosamine-specific phosphotransferase system component IIC